MGAFIFGADDVLCIYVLCSSRLMGSALLEKNICALAKNSPPDCFLNARLRFPIRLTKNKKAPLWVLFIFGADDGNRTHTISLEG